MASILRRRNTPIRKTPTVLQMEAAECGAASLAMVLGYHNYFSSLEELRLKCGVTRDGSKASNLLKAARSVGMTARGYKKEPAELRAMPMPAIVFWNFNHFLVVEGFHDGKVYLNDPAFGRRVVSDDEFDQSFTGVTLTFEPGPDFKTGGERAEFSDRLRQRFNGLESAATFLLLVAIAAVVPGIVIPALSSAFIDKVLIAGLDNWLKPLLIGMLMTAVLRIALASIENHYLLRAQTQMALSSASKFFWHALRLPVEFYTQRSHAEISARVGLNDRVARLLAGDLARTLLGTIQAVLFVIMMFYYDAVLALITIAVLGVNVAVLRSVAPRLADLNQKLALDNGKVMAASVNGLTIMETIKSRSGETDFFARWAGHQARYINTEQQVARLNMIVGAATPFLTALTAALVLGSGGLRIIDGHLSIGMLVAFQSLVASITAPLNHLIGLGSKLQAAKDDLNRLDNILQYPVESLLTTDNAIATNADAASKLQGNVELRNVTFGYNRADPPLLEDFNLQGERLAIVGPSGSGRSTLSRLLMGLYQPWSGDLLFDGMPRQKYDRHRLANSLALVDQDIVLFEGTIRDNITLWDDSIPEADMMQAARDACIHDVILARPGGYNSRVEEGGANLSAGQRQRLEIARALATNPRILVLDEATSALDAKTEKQIDDNLRRRGCTCIIIAHRLSTVRDASETIVLAAGRIIERGTHDSLIANPDGAYSRLIALQ